MEAQEIPGWGIDRDVATRPGHPLEQERYVDHDTLMGQGAWQETVPLHGASGRLRRAAYALPTHAARRWMLLMVADRIDAIESRLTWRKALLGAGAVGGALVGVGLVLRGRARKRRR
jgi:hypothetical protein